MTIYFVSSSVKKEGWRERASCLSPVSFSALLLSSVLPSLKRDCSQSKILFKTEGSSLYLSILCLVFIVGPQAGNELIFGMENVTVLFLA